MNDAKPTPKPQPLSPSQIERYSRQLLLPRFGIESQKKLLSSRILIIGLGGLGSPAALYLSGAGIGTLGLVDRPNETVETSNLHRQIAHTESRVGQSKVESAATAIRALNSSVKLEKHEAFTRTNAVQIVSGYDAVLDCTDNVASRYLISDACAATRTPLISGAAIGLDGQLSVYCLDEEGPCYRCMFPRAPPMSCVGSCDGAGVLGPVAGVVGTLQALEAMKVVGGMRGEGLGKRMLMFDGGDCEFRTVKLRGRVEGCVGCGEGRVEVGRFDYETFAKGGEVGEDGVDGKWRMSAVEFAEVRRKGWYRLIDVRPKIEFEMCHLEEAESHPLSCLSSLLSSSAERKDDEDEKQMIFICRRGNASQKAVKLAIQHNVENVIDVVGGLQAWHYQVDAKFPLY